MPNPPYDTDSHEELSPEENGNLMQSIDDTLKDQQELDNEMTSTIQAISAKKRNASLEGNRIHAKVTLAQFARLFELRIGDDRRLQSILSDIRTYADMEVTAVRGDYDREVALYDKIYHDVEAYYKELDAKQTGTDDYDPEALENRTSYQITADLFNFFESRRNGDLVPDLKEPGAVFIDGRAHPLTFRGAGIGFRNVSDKPLFPHEPNPNDISQGWLGDCYMLAALSSLSETAPQRIRDCMCDNGDGTVTVRFFTQKLNEETGKNEGTTPIYVTVDKKIPGDIAASDCLWVQMIERAYAASGLHLGSYKHGKPLPSKEELDREYRRIEKLPKEERPTHSEYPWLIDTTGNLHHWRPDYLDIEGGSSHMFLSQLLGDDSVPEYNNLSNQRDIEKSNQLDCDALGGYILSSACLQVLGDNVTEEDRKLVQDDFMFVNKTVARSLFRALYPDREVPLAANGYIDTSHSALAEACECFVGAFKSSLVLDDDMDNVSSEDVQQSYAKSMADINKVMADPQDPSVPFVLREYYKSFLDITDTITDPSVKEHLFQFLRNDLVPALANFRDDAVNKYSAIEPYSGNYLGYMLDAYQTIQKNIDLGYPAFADTPGESDRKSHNGILDNHAYSVLGVTEKNIGGRNLKFVKLRNPHGQTGRKYTEKDGTLVPEAYPDAPGGVFDMELGDFCKEFYSYSFSCIGKEPPIPAAEADNANVNDHIFIGTTVHDYEKMLVNIFNSLDTTLKDSPSFRNVYRKVQSHLRDDDISHYQGESIKKIYRYSNLSELRESCVKYLDHCTKDPKNNARRANRIKQVNNLLTYVESIEKGYKDPKDCLGEKMLEKMMEGNKTYQKQNPNQKLRSINTFLESRQYKHWKQSMTLDAMAELAERKTPEILKHYKENVLAHFEKAGDRNLNRELPEALNVQNVQSPQML